jgi:hypothetical protein
VLYLSDASVLMTANRTYYPIDRVPEFWSWLQHQGSQGKVKIPMEVMEEILDGRKEDDLLLNWLREKANMDALILDESVDETIVEQVVSQGYAKDLTDDEVEVLGRDPFLIAYGLSGADRCVVTTEVSRPSKQRQNRAIPDVCRSLAVSCCGPFEVNRALDFRTGWSKTDSAE